MLTPEHTDSAARRFNDTLAARVDWTPLQRGGTSFASQRRSVSASRFRWRPTAMVWALAAMFVLPALLVLVALLASGQVSGDPFSWILPVIALLFIAFGVRVPSRHRLPVVFDRGVGWYWRGEPRSQSSADIGALSEAARLADLYALQLIGGQMNHGTHASWRTFELNLILQDGRRLPVITHGNLRRLREDAGALATWLALPLWDALT